MKLLSDAAVEFTYLQHRGNASHGMQVELLPSKDPPKPDQLLSIGGFRRVLLQGHVDMDLSANDGPLHVTCDESFDVLRQKTDKQQTFGLDIYWPLVHQ